MTEYTQDGPEAQKIADVIPYYPFHGVPRFYDISGMTHNPEAFQSCIDVFVNRYKDLDVDAIAGLDARGFVLGPPIALALKKPFIMIRKKGKLPGAVISEAYQLEYGEAIMEIHDDALKFGEKVLIVDDLLATGGTAEAAIKLCRRLGAEVVGCAFVIDLPELGGRALLESLEMPVHALCEFEGA